VIRFQTAPGFVLRSLFLLLVLLLFGLLIVFALLLFLTLILVFFSAFVTHGESTIGFNRLSLRFAIGHNPQARVIGPLPVVQKL